MLKLESLYKSYGDKVIFSDFSQEFPTRGAVCISGPSGCGKTTLLRLIAGLESADSGRIVREGTLTLMFQEDRLLPYCSALENVACVLQGRRQSRLERARALLDAVHLSDSALKSAATLSGGMKRRVALARALAPQPDILLLDEPLTGLDDELRTAMLQLIADFARDRLVLCATHDTQDAAALDASVLTL